MREESRLKMSKFRSYKMVSNGYCFFQTLKADGTATATSQVVQGFLAPIATAIPAITAQSQAEEDIMAVVLGQVDEVQVVNTDGTTSTVKLRVIAVVGGGQQQSEPATTTGGTGDGPVS